MAELAPTRRMLSALVCVAAFGLASCGDEDLATTTPGPIADQLVAPDEGTVDTTPDTAAEGAGTVSAGDADPGEGDFSAPKDADAPGVPRRSSKRGLRVTPPQGDPLRWRVRAKDGEDDEFCVHLSIPGPFDPDPACSSGELIALGFFGDDHNGPAIGNVTQAPLTARDATSRMVVYGIASGDVDTVRVEYRQKTYDATLSEQVVDLPVDQKMARALSGATRRQIDRLPDPVTVRAFGVSFPRDAGNAPRVVNTTTPRAVDGVVTLQLS